MNPPTGAKNHPSQQLIASFSLPSRIAVLGLAIILLLAFFFVAFQPRHMYAQTGEPMISLDPPQAHAGAVVLINGSGFGPGGNLTLLWDGEEIATPSITLSDTFSIPFPIPTDAAPGDHQIDVCTGNPCGTGELDKKAGAPFRVTGAMPYFSSTIAYIYNNDKALAAEFATLLAQVGFSMITIPASDVTLADINRFDLVIVGSDTGGDGQWGSTDQVAALNKASRIVGVGKGGHALFGELDLAIGAPNGVATTGSPIEFRNAQLTSARIPYDLSSLSRNQWQIPLFSRAVNAVTIDLTNLPAGLIPHAYLDKGDRVNTDGVVVGQGCRTLWGFDGSPREMTLFGRMAFTNLIVFALGNNCNVRLAAPCNQLADQATIPGSTVINFDDIESGMELADFYAKGYGVRFEQSSTNHAVAYGGNASDLSQPRSAPNVAKNEPIIGGSQGIPFLIDFEQDQSHVGVWIGNGEDSNGNLANLTAILTAYDRQGTELCSTLLNPVPTSHSAFLGLNDALGRIARLELDYGSTPNSETIDDLIFGPFAPANSIRVCDQQENGCIPASNARVVIMRDGGAVSPPAQTDIHGYVLPRSRIKFGDTLWVTYPVSTTTNTTFYHTNGAPRRVRALDFNHFADDEMSITVSPNRPLLIYNLIVSTQWSLIGDTAYRDRLRSHIQKAANYLYDFTDGQMSLGDVQIYQNYDMWDEADVRIYASNHMRPRADIGGVSEVDVPDPLVADLNYYPGYTFMGRTWNRFNLPGEPSDLGVDISNDWPLALAHELGHYLLYLFDTYLAVTADGEIVETKNCTGSAMGWVYGESNTEFIFHPGHWDSACGDTLANHILERTEWETILLWYETLLTPTAVNPGPTAPPVSTVNVTIHPPTNPAVVLPNQTFTLNYQAGETASSEARAFLIRNNRVIDQGKPTEGSTEITLIGSQTSDRFCVYDVNDFTDDDMSPRHQYGCEILTLGDNVLQMEKDDGWAPIIEISHAASRTIGISVTQAISIGLPMRAVLYPEDTDTPTEIVLTTNGDLHTGTFYSPVDATSAYIQLYVDEDASGNNPRRETMVDYGVGGGGAEGPATWYGGVPVISSDGKAEFARRTNVFLKRGEFVALQSMAGTPRPPVGRRIVGQTYRLLANPRTLANQGYVTLHVRRARNVAQPRQDLPNVVVAFWNGTTWRAIKSINLTDLIDERVAIAPAQGMGVYALLLAEETPPTNRLYLPTIER